MLSKYDLPKYFWAEVVNTSCYIINRVHLRRNQLKAPYEIWKGKKPNISYFHPFGCKVFILNNDKENLGKFDANLMLVFAWVILQIVRLIGFITLGQMWLKSLYMLNLMI